MGKKTKAINEYLKSCEQKIEDYLKDNKKYRNNDKRCNPILKKKKYDYFLTQLNKNFDIQYKMIRNPKDWKSKSFNDDVQMKSFIKHCYEKYNTPGFLYNCFFDENESQFIKWFFCVSQGDSLIKLTSDIFSRKEVNIFLKLKDKSILYNILSTKLISLNINKNYHPKIISSVMKFFNQRNNFNLKNKVNFLSDYFQLLSKGELNNNIDFSSISDYLYHIEHNLDRNNFSFKGRTLNSLIRLCDEWHQEQFKKKQQNTVKHWEAWKINDFEFLEYLDEMRILFKTWTIKQLLSSNQLFKESNVLKHCVSSYVGRCSNNSTRIFSLMCDDKKELTIEVFNNQSKFSICQVKGKFNRPPSRKEISIIDKWARKENLKMNFN